MTTIVKFTLALGHIPVYRYWSDTPNDASGDYVSLAEYQEVINLVNELGEKDVQNRLQVDKLKALIQRVNEIGPKLTDSLKWSVKLLGATEGHKSSKLIQLLEDCQNALK